ncbi:MarR family EPS-associated transcriptional regulator [Algiphilus sp.]|uniref:MarR family EPS-associated transcriptional regulator n=1 Tax=Algiphilus sp. TaxID=1872431 RepID=UPI0032EF5205
MAQLSDEMQLKVLRVLEAEPEISQRQLAKRLGVSLGKTNYCIRALLQQGYIKARNFGNSKNKRAYIYKLTAQGISAKAQATRHFLARKEREYDELAEEIERMRGELSSWEMD